MTTMARSAAIILEGGRVALIERHNDRGVYYVFPGGHIEAGEAPAVAAARETCEELGLEVEVGRLVAEVTFRGSVQYYFLARVIGGAFGTGSGPEMVGDVPPGRGSYTPVWLTTAELLTKPVFPARVAALVEQASTGDWLRMPHRYVEA
ncbi:MAG: NUDIX domain-containing protein [Chloroflexi bacterium]|nr:NUDIX domain-containing protein [Chloroflexota bacterium]